MMASSTSKASASAKGASERTTPDQHTAAQWEQTTRLSDSHHQLIARLSTLVEERPMPDALSSAQEVERTAEYAPFSPLKLSSGGDEMETIEDMQQFYCWFDELKHSHERQAEEPYVEYLEMVNGYVELCDSIIGEMSDAIGALDRLEEQYSTVSVKSGQLHTACEELVAHQERLIEFSDALARSMDYFNDLDVISSRLSSPSLNVLDASFFSLLDRVDECLEFLTKNATFKESPTYTKKFQHLQSRALTMVKTYIISSLRSTTNHIKTGKSSEGRGTPSEGSVSSPEEDEASRANVKFRALAVKLKPLCEAIERRTESNSTYKGLLSDCHTCYVQQRKMLIGPAVAASTRAIVESTDLGNAIRTGCTFLLRTCVTEHQLFTEFFEPSLSAMKGLLEAFAGELYETFRPLFIRNRDIDVLCGAIVLLKDEVLDDKLTSSLDAIQWVQGTVQRMIGDIQERVSFLAQMYIRDEIVNYAPSADDLKYPDCLKDNATAQPGKGARKHHLYPVLDNCKTFLDRLYTAIDSNIFADLAQEAVGECTVSLRNAARTIKNNVGSLDSDLFLIRHLVILREQISRYEIEFCIEERSLDFSGMRGALQTFVRGVTGSGIGSLFSLSRNNSLLSLMGSTPPKVVPTKVDSKRALEKELSKTIDEFVSSSIKPVLEPLSSFLTWAQAFLSVQEQRAKQTDEQSTAPVAILAEQDHSSPGHISEIVEHVLTKSQPTFQQLGTLVRLYMPHTASANRLIDLMMEQLCAGISSLHEILLEHYSEEQRAVVNLPPPNEARSILMQLFSEAAAPATSGAVEEMQVKDGSSRADGSEPAGASASVDVGQ